MAAATIGVLYFVGAKDFTGFLAMFLILFVTTGVGNGSTYRMIPSIFREGKFAQGARQGRSRPGHGAEDREHRERRGRRIHRRDRRLWRLPDPERLRPVDRGDRGPQLALIIYLSFYACCLAMTWWFYLRRSTEEAGASSLAGARI